LFFSLRYSTYFRIRSGWLS